VKNFYQRLKILTAGVMVVTFTSAWAEHWVRVASSETSYFYADKDAVKKTGEFYYLNVKRNSKDDQKKSSSLLKYKIDCKNNSFQLEDSKVFTDMDFVGDEVYSKPQGLGEIKVAVPNSIGEKYVRVVCDDFKNFAKDKAGSQKSDERLQIIKAAEDKNQAQQSAKLAEDKRAQEEERKRQLLAAKVKEDELIKSKEIGNSSNETRGGTNKINSVQINPQADMRKIGPLEVIMCMYASVKFQMSSNADLSGLSKSVFRAYTTLANTIPPSEGEVVSQDAGQRLQRLSLQDQLLYIVSCAKNPVAKPYLQP